MINQINYLKVNHLKWVELTHFSNKNIRITDCTVKNSMTEYNQ